MFASPPGPDVAVSAGLAPPSQIVANFPLGGTGATLTGPPGGNKDQALEIKSSLMQTNLFSRREDEKRPGESLENLLHFFCPLFWPTVLSYPQTAAGPSNRPETETCCHGTSDILLNRFTRKLFAQQSSESNGI